MVMIAAAPSSTLTIETPLATIALQGDAHVAVLQRHRLDFCCGGRRTLSDACAAAGLDPRRVLQEIAAEARERAPGRPIAWHDRPIPVLVRHIVDVHHAFTRTALLRTRLLLDRVLGKHAAAHPEIIAIARIVQRLGAELEPHLVREEKVLFPYILSLCGDEAPLAPRFGSLLNPLRVMEAEHRSAGALLEDLRRLTGDFAAPGDACATYRALYGVLFELRDDLMVHVALENEVLFPRALAMEERRLGGRRPRLNT